MDKSKNLHGHLFALTANVMWGLMAPIGKSALQVFRSFRHYIPYDRSCGCFLDVIYIL